MARKIQIVTPKGSISTYTTATGRIVARLDWKPGFKPDKEKALNDAQSFVDSEVLRLSDPYIPFLTGILKKSGTLGTDIGSGEVRYIAPYARKQYYTNRGNGKRGKLWFERMKADHKQAILNGAAKITRGEK